MRIFRRVALRFRAELCDVELDMGKGGCRHARFDGKGVSEMVKELQKLSLCRVGGVTIGKIGHSEGPGAAVDGFLISVRVPSKYKYFHAQNNWLHQSSLALLIQ